MSKSLNVIGQVSAESQIEPEALASATSLFAEVFPTGSSARRVLFIHPPDCTSDVFKFDVAHRGGYYNFPPYGLGVLASRVRSAGYEAKSVACTKKF